MQIKAIYAAAVLALSGCASPQGPVSPDANLKPESTAYLVVYRPRTQFHRANPELPFVYVNDQQVGKLRVDGAIDVKVPAGQHIVAIKEPIAFMPAYESHRLTITAEAGKTYFVRYSREASGVTTGGHVTATTGLALVPAEVGIPRK